MKTIKFLKLFIPLCNVQFGGAGWFVLKKIQTNGMKLIFHQMVPEFS
jgi:hypothetical protein